MTGPVLGIDLGTTTTIASVIRDGIPEVIPVEGGSRFLIPSVVHFGENGEVLSVGTEAKKQKLPSPTRTVFSIKRIIGRTFSHPDTEVAIMRFPFPIVEGSNDSVLLNIGRKSYSPQEVSSFVLQKAIEYAHRHLGEPTDRVVITVPANFNEAQRRATQNAGKLAGLDVLRIINEPTAAALAYGFGNTANERVAVYDLGGGTFDISILETRNKVLDVLSTGGNSFLG
ncbi:MAG TPA: Hsp70 family protein, partial [bacterium]|nr:Hsp70 family protein [bacterium]